VVGSCEHGYANFRVLENAGNFLGGLEGSDFRKKTRPPWS
jgi:hypothetical protein